MCSFHDSKVAVKFAWMPKNKDTEKKILNLYQEKSSLIDSCKIAGRVWRKFSLVDRKEHDDFDWHVQIQMEIG